MTDARRLIVVDDEPVILELLGSLFDGEEGVEVISCATGRAALEAMQQGVDVLLTDKNLPDIGGLDLLAHARRLQPDAEVILITGYASLETALKALQLGAFDYIVKPPPSIFDVKRKVEQAFQRQDILRENRALVRQLSERNEALAAKNRDLQDALRRLQALQDELVQAEKLAGIGTLAAGVAHEVSSPLFGILGLAEALTDETDLATVHHYAGEIVTYSRSIRDIVGQLTGYARDAALDVEAPTVVADVVRSAASLLQRSLGCGEHQLHLDVDERAQVAARVGELQQVFVNLLKNGLEAAMEHKGELGRVRVRVVCTETGEVVATVTDDGPGIAEEHRSAIFDPFFTTKPVGQGTGLGLNVVYRLVARQHGHISVGASEHGGACFTVRWPMAS